MVSIDNDPTIVLRAASGDIREPVPGKKSAVVGKLEKIEEDIKRAKLKEVKRMKEELEQKLVSLSENVNVLSDTPRGKRDKAGNNKPKQEIEEEQRQKQKEAEEFVRKMKELKRERKHKEQEREREEQERRKKESDDLNRSLKQREDELLRKRINETRKTYDTLRQKREADVKRLEEHQAKITLPAREDDYLYKKLEDKYRREVLLPTLESKKKELAKKRNFYKPVSKEEIDDHIRKYETLMAQKEEERVEGFKMRKQREESVQHLIHKFKTPALERASLQEEKVREELGRKKSEKHALREKMESYASIVKDTVPVHVDGAKAAELKKQIEQLKCPVRQSRDLRKHYDLAVINGRMNKEKMSAHSVDRMKKDRTEGDIASARAEAEKAPPQMRLRQSTSTKSRAALKAALSQQHERELEQKKIEQANAKRVNYLAELRRKREENCEAQKAVKYDWDKDLKNSELGLAEKYDKVVGKANKIEEQAKMREKLLLAKGGPEKNLAMGECVSDMFIDAIKAKLAILENL